MYIHLNYVIFYINKSLEISVTQTDFYLYFSQKTSFAFQATEDVKICLLCQFNMSFVSSMFLLQ